MNSIRSYLVLRLLIGFVLVMSVASVLIFFISKRILESDFDSRLFAKAQVVIASTSQKGDTLDVDWANLPQELGPHGKQGNLIQILDGSGRQLEGDSFVDLGTLKGADQTTFRNVNSLQGRKLRILTLSFLPSVEEEDLQVTPSSVRQRCFLIVGSDRDPLDHSLKQMAEVLGATTVLTSIFSLGIVALVLRKGLRPLATLSREVAQIDELSLERRVDLDALPTEVLPIAEKLNDLLSRLEVSFARERRFSADVSHELRTPIAELRSLSEVLLREPDLPANMQQAFQDVLDASRQMEAIVSALLEIVRQERNTSILEREQIELGSFLRASWKSNEAKAQLKNLKVTFDCPDTLKTETDSRLLRLVLNNLFSNAVEYTPAGGTIEIFLQKSGENALISIQNTAQDVKAQDLPHFFERFWRNDKVRGDSEHLGLGLSLTQLLCRRLQIHLTVSMPKPDIVCFWLALPPFLIRS